MWIPKITFPGTEALRGRDQTDLAPVDSEGLSQPGSVVKDSSGTTKRGTLVTIEEAEMLEKVITEDRARGVIGVDEVDKV